MSNFLRDLAYAVRVLRKNPGVTTVMVLALALGLAVNRLIRVSYGPFQLGKMIEGTVDEVPRRVLKEQLGDCLKGETEVAKARRQEKVRGTDANRRRQP